MITQDNDYSYIEIFIRYLKEIIEIIKDLFSGINLGGGNKGGNDGGDAGEAEPQA